MYSIRTVRTGSLSVMNLALVILASIAIAAVLGTIMLAARDGYRRMPARRA